MAAPDSRALVVDAARELFTHRGFHGTTIRAIASAASVSPSLVIKIFGSKSALYAVCGAADVPVDGIDVSLAQVGTALVRRIAQRRIDGAEEPWSSATTAIRGAEDTEQERVRVREVWLAWLSDVIDDRSDRREHATAIACLLLGFAEGLRTFGFAESEDALELLTARFAKLVQTEVDRVERS